MSDEVIRSLNQQLSEANAKNTKLQVALREARRERQAALDEAQKVRSELDETISNVEAAFANFDTEKGSLESQVKELAAKLESNPSELQGKIDELTGQIRTRDFKDAWKSVIGDTLQDKVSIEDLWSKAGFDPAKHEGDSIDNAAIAELLGKAKDAAPYLFRAAPPGSEKPGDPGKSQGSQLVREALTTPNHPSRGVRDSASGQITYTKRDIQTPSWEKARPELAEAMANGTAVLVDG